MNWEIISYRDRLAELASRAVPWLSLHEAENNFILSMLIAQAKRGISRGGFWLARGPHDELGLLAAIPTSDPRLALSRTEDKAAIALLAAKLREERIKLPGAVGPADVIEEFAEQWEDLSGARTLVTMRQGIFELKALAAEPPVGGTLRLAKSRELDILAAWFHSFLADTGLSKETNDVRGLARAKIEAGDLYVWEVDGNPVAMAGKAGPTLSGIRVNLVFTPAHLRGNHYASAVVTALTAKMLESGYRETYLFTDLANASSNRIYERIGYTKVGEARTVEFSY